MENNNLFVGFNKKAKQFFHDLMMLAMLHSCLVAPSQTMIFDYLAAGKPLHYQGMPALASGQDLPEPAPITTPIVSAGNTATTQSGLTTSGAISSGTKQSFSADINFGIIGTTTENPLDDATDNLFKFSIPSLPEGTFRTYITYELYGISDNLGVAKSVNDNYSIAGYIVKKQPVWTMQREEINADWLRAGENKIMFAIPAGANYQYQVRNVNVEIERVPPGEILAKLIINNGAANLTKNNQVYVKGFVRGKHTNLSVVCEGIALNVSEGAFEGFVTLTEAMKRTHMLAISAHDSGEFLGQEIVSLENLSEADAIFPIASRELKAVSLFKKGIAAPLQLAGARLNVGKDALDSDRIISIVKLRPVDVAPLESGMINVTKGAAGYRFLPDGTKFSNPVTIELGYDKSLLPPGYTHKDIKTFYFNTQSKRWVTVETDSINLEAETITAVTTHFTDYINGVIQSPENPETAGFTPTMMNDVKAGDASSEMTIISPPTVSQKGDANVSYPIKIPAGRNGIQPQLTLQYSNEGGNGWFGQGWNISVPALSIDTRWGTPLLDPVNESEIYTLGGEQLMYPNLNGENWMPNRHYEITGTPSTVYSTQARPRETNAVFTPRKQGTFIKVERLGNNTSDYYWKVTAADGSIQWYGGKNGVVENSVIKNADGKIVHWGLYMSEDVHTNNVIYEYTNEVIPTQSGENANLNGGRIFTVKNIYYTGYQDAKGKYIVQFVPKTAVREDVSVNARLGVKQIEPYFIDYIRIGTTRPSAQIRKYVFNIGYGKFKKGQLRWVAELDRGNKEFYRHTFDYYDDLNQDGTDVYFSAAITQEICNDTPCPDDDNDGVCNSADLCITQPGPASNNGCPGSCYYVSGQINTSQVISTVTMTTSSGTQTVGSFNLNSTAGFNQFLTALGTQLGTTIFANNDNGSIHFVVWYANAPLYSITISNSGGVFVLNSAPTPCAMRPVKEKRNGMTYTDYFGQLANNYTISYSGSASGGNPNCPWFLNTNFLIQGNIPSFNSAGAILGSTVSKNFNLGGHLGFGIDFSWDPTTKNITVGGGYNHSWDESESLTALVDIDGDGLDDLVYKYFGLLYYKKHLVTRTYNSSNEPIITHSFSSFKPIHSVNNEISDFFRSTGESSSWNIQVNFGFSGVGAFAGWDTSRNNSKNTIYFTDANADGLIDVVKYGTAYFNRIDGSGNPYFEPESLNTENMLIQAAPVTVTPPPVEEDVNTPKYDVVKVWEAPMDGAIKIENTITNLDTTKEAVVTIEMEKPGTTGSCGATIFPEGGNGTYTYTVDFGPAIGIAGINYNSYSIPDKFDILWNGQLYSSGYRGDSGQNQDLLDLGVSGVFPDQINTASPTNGIGTLTFNKNSASPSTAQIIVYGPLGGTNWEFTSICPGAGGRRMDPDSNSKEYKQGYDLTFEVPASIDANETTKILVNNFPLNKKTAGYRLSARGGSGNDAFIRDFEKRFPEANVVFDNGSFTIKITGSYRKFDAISLIGRDSTITHQFISQSSETELEETAAARVNPYNCSYIPTSMCLLYGVKLNAATPSVTNVLTTASTTCTPSGGNLMVKRGDRIYFRTHCITTGNPSVDWNPRVSYTGPGLEFLTDQNNSRPYSSRYDEGFLLSQQVPVVFPGNGTVTISWSPLTVTNPTDDVTYQIIKRTSNGSTFTDTPIYTQLCTANATTTVTATGLGALPVTGTTAAQTTQFLFRAFSTSNIRWKSNQWRPEMEFTTTQPVIGSGGPEGNVSVVEKKYPIVDYSIYKPFLCGNYYTTINITPLSSGVNKTIAPNLPSSLFTFNDNGQLYFVVKRGNAFLARRTVTVTNGLVSVSGGGPIALGIGGVIEVSYYTDDSRRPLNSPTNVSLLRRLLNASSVATIAAGMTNHPIAPSQVNLMHKDMGLYGPMLRSWGQFMYKASAASGATPIPSLGVNLLKEEQLTFTEGQALALHNSLLNSNHNINANLTTLQNIDMNNPSAAATIQQTLQNIQNSSGINNFPFLMASPSRDNENGNMVDKWIGIHNECYSSAYSARAATLSQAFSFQDDGVTSQASFNTGAYGIDKYSRGNGQSVSGGGGFGGFGASGTSSLGGVSNSLTDYIDLNGDRYPDIVTTGQIQYTLKTGGLYAPVGRGAFGGDISTDHNGSWGFTASGSFGKSGKKNSGEEGAKPVPNGKLMIGKPSTNSFGGGNSSLGISGNFGQGDNETSRIWADMNGDGLADIISRSGGVIGVHLNLGTTNFNGNNFWGSFTLADGQSTTFGGGLGFNYANGSIEAGVSLGRTDSDTENLLTDMNGDGMLDKVSSGGGNITMDFNRGNRFPNTPVTVNSFSLFNNATTATAGINGTGTYSLIWPLYLIFIVIPLKIPDVSVTVSGGTSTNRTKKTLTDFDGDGYSDLVEEISSNTVKVSHSRIRRTDMLKTVYNPLGGNFVVDYVVQPIDYNNPHPKWTMKSIVMHDGYDKINDGEDVYKKEFVYENGRYDRRERDFYGYGTVKTLDYLRDEDGNPTSVYRTSVAVYHNNSYFLNGLLKESYTLKGDDPNSIYTRTINTYEIKQLNSTNTELIPTSLLPDTFDVGGREGRKTAAALLTRTVNEFYELNSSPQLITQSDITYDEKGRVKKYQSFGNLADPGDDYTTEISYHNLPNNIICVAKEIRVSVNSSELRRRTTTVDPSTGKIIAIKAYLDTTNFAPTTMEYDQYGNLALIKYPPNGSGQSMTYKYAYDTDFNKYVVGISDSFGYSSSAIYDYNFDKVLETTDAAGNKMAYSYDSFSRIDRIIAPKEIEAGLKYTIKFRYYPKFSDLPSGSGVTASTFVPVALTQHFDMQHPTNDIETYTFIDGLGRPIQMKKDITLNKDTTHHSPDYFEALSVSGKTFYDLFARNVQQFHPFYELKNTATRFLLNEYDAPYSTNTELDELDRTVKTVDADGNVATVEYSLEQDANSIMAIKARSVTEQNGSQSIITENYKDTSGRILSTMHEGPNGPIWTKYHYDGIGQLRDYTDDGGLTTSYKYDRLGRKQVMSNPDNGTTQFKYDLAGNLVQLQTANLANDGTYIDYKYSYNRLTSIHFPQNPDNTDNLSNVSYKYGNSGNSTGRVVFQQDGTGTQTFKYGNMGEVTFTRRIVVGPSPSMPVRAFASEYAYDSFNRLQKMAYPDGEEVSFSYDLGGNLNRISGMVSDHPYNYIERLDYDYYEQRAFLLYGNKTQTFYNYTPGMRKLENLRVLTADGQDLYNNTYKYDYVGNVLGISNNAGITSNYMAGNYEHGFAYDNLNRLIKAQGKFTGSPIQQEMNNDFASDYALDMKYSNTHQILSKRQSHNKNGSVYAPNSYSNDYKYESATHQIQSITDGWSGVTESFKFDSNGNLFYKENTLGNQRFMYWDESNRLRVVNDNNNSLQHYIYDASGQRILKAGSDVQFTFQNGTLLDPASVSFNSYMSYPSAYLVIDGYGIYTKHYFAGSQRIASKIGEKGPEYFNVEAGGRIMEADEPDPMKIRQLQVADLNIILEKAHFGKASFKEFKPFAYDDMKKAIASENKDDDPATTAAPGPIDPIDQFPALYFYHPDHLGTSTALTDFNGKSYQFFINLPYGEAMAEQLPSSFYKTPYKFNGKELDEETGLYYYGARFYDPKISLWYSADPLGQVFPGSTPYEYCFSNPINLVDPTGMGPGDPETHTVVKGDNLSVIARKYGVSIKDLQAMNGIEDKNKIYPGQVLKVNPEANFSTNPRGSYKNPNSAHGEEVIINHIAEVGINFALGNGDENQVIVGGGALKSVQNWDEVKTRVRLGIDVIKSDGAINPGETYYSECRPGDLPSNIQKGLKEGWEKLKKLENPLRGNSQNSPIHVLGSFNFSLRVNADGKTVTACVYDSKTFGSFTDNKGGSNKPRNKGQGTPFGNTYQRYIWTIKL